MKPQCPACGKELSESTAGTFCNNQMCPNFGSYVIFSKPSQFVRTAPAGESSSHGIGMSEQETINETKKHINNVMNCILMIIQELLERARTHDDSKLCSPELETFMIYTPKLATSTYGSDEYKQFLAEMKPALDHHYECNRHHPEHFKTWVCSMCHQGHREKPARCSKCGTYFPDANPEIILKPDISQMNLVDIIEMLCDWKAATMRHNDGDLLKSIEFNKGRFQISDQLTQIFLNTVSLFEKKEQSEQEQEQQVPQ